MLGLTLLSSTSNAEILPGTTLSLDFHAASISANGTKINMHRVPVTDVPTGKTTYWDAEFVFGLQPDGSITFTRTASAAQSTTQLLNGQAFIPGKYKDVNGVLYNLEGPVANHPNQSAFNKDQKDGPAFGIMGFGNFAPVSSTNYWTFGYAVAAIQFGGNGLTVYSYGTYLNPLVSFDLVPN